MRLAPGTSLGPYEIVAPIGAGGMGEVYRARDTRLAREVALKVLSAEFARDPERRARFEREARAVARLNHPNIVVLHSIEEAGGVRFLTMELVEGVTIDRLIAQGALAADRLLDLALALADALVAAHEKGVVHRDLKPANVMVSSDGRVKVLDFGLARPTLELAPDGSRAPTTALPLSAAGQVFGTVPYMAPEQLRGEATDARTDLFAFGILLYELATGRRPFAGKTNADVGSAILRDTPDPIGRARADLPSSLDGILARCLEKDPARRFQSARDVREAITRAQREGASRAGATTTATASRPTTTQDSPSIAVLPFANLSRDQENEYFSDGLAEELLNMLAKIRGLRVAARTSSFHFKGKQPTIAEVGRALNVATVLEGSVRRAGNRVRITVQLVNVADGYHLWSETYERGLDDIFAVQDEVARAVVDSLPGELLVSRDGLGATRGSRDRAAYDAYLEGRFFWNKRTESDTRKAIQFFERAIQLDPAYAEAWAGLADGHVVLPFYSLVATGEAHPRAREALDRALALKPDLSAAHATLAYALMIDWQWEASEREFRRAIELDPDDAMAHKWYADLLMMTGRPHAGFRAVHRALELDPLNANILTIMGAWYWREGRLEEAMAQYLKAFELQPVLPLALELAARLCWQRDDVDQYFTWWERLEAVSPRVPVPTSALRQAHAAGGRRAVLRAQLDAPLARRLPSDRARWHAELGDFDAAFRDLDDSAAQREIWLPDINYFADFAPLWKDPRFAALQARMGLPPAVTL